MKAHEFISSLDESRNGNRRLREDKAPVAAAPSHAPTKTEMWKTPSSGKSEDKGEHNGGEKDAIKMSKHSIPATIAKAPSHAPTSGTDATTKGNGGSEDQGEKISKEAMKENLLNRLLNANDEADISAIMAEAELREGGHKAGCKCGFCANKGSFGKKKSEPESEKESDDEDDGMNENFMPAPGRPRPGMPMKRRIGGGSSDRMSFRHPAGRPRPKAASLPGGAMNPNQPSMERLDRSHNPRKTVQEMADELLESPE